MKCAPESKSSTELAAQPLRSIYSDNFKVVIPVILCDL